MDFDFLEPTNRPRVVSATPWDMGDLLVDSRFRILRWLGHQIAKHKVRIAGRTARRANRSIIYQEVIGNVGDLDVAMQLRDLD